MRPEFLQDGKFYRSTVVTEVRDRRLSRDEIKQLDDDPEMRAEFFGDLTPYKRPKTEWDERYLERLSLVAGGECFNVEYLLYLDEVTDYVTKAPYRKMRNWGIAGVLLIIVGIILWRIATKQ